MANRGLGLGDAIARVALPPRKAGARDRRASFHMPDRSSAMRALALSVERYRFSEIKPGPGLSYMACGAANWRFWACFNLSNLG